jgi:hypothetical protein
MPQVRRKIAQSLEGEHFAAAVSIVLQQLSGLR